MNLSRLERVVFNPMLHQYLLDGDVLLSGVTTLLKKHGLAPSEYGDIPAKVLGDAATRGTAIHEMLEQYDNHGIVIPFEVRNDEGEVLATESEMSANLKAYKRLNLPVVSSEWLISDLELVASSIDKVIATTVENEFILGDVKTTATKHEESWSWQLSIYAYLFEFQHPGAKVVGIEVIHVRDGKGKIIPLKRKPDSKVEVLLNCERLGLIYSEDETKREGLSKYIGENGEEELMTCLYTLQSYEQSVKMLKAEVEKYTRQLYDKMLESGVEEVVTRGGKFVLKKPYTKQSLDTTKLKKKYQDIYEECLSTSEVRGNVSYKEDIK